ncbi:unannotated protein [freshwater metagenome]|uniref:Unannotated protein n=1 Tax=freshwater metagenome TaxID=449393 RepID=A0A6J6ABB8_9ZZZZ
MVATVPRTPTVNTLPIRCDLAERVASASEEIGGSTPESGSLTSRERRIAGHSTSTPKRTTNGTAGVRFSWNGRNHGFESTHLGRNVPSSAITMPSPRPPANARGRLTSRPRMAAAIATTTRLKKSGAARVLNRGAMSTPARPAKVLDKAQLTAETRSERIPFNSVIRGLSTTARICRPIAVKRNSAAKHSMAMTATPMVVSSSRLKG